MDKKVVIALGIWVSGFVAGVVFIARSLRTGDPESAASTSTSTATPDPDSPIPPTSKVRDGVQRVTVPIAAATKADVIRVRHAVSGVNRRVMSSIDAATGHRARAEP